MTVLLSADDVDQSIKVFVSVSDRFLGSLLGLGEFGHGLAQTLVAFSQDILQTLIAFASCGSLTQSSSDHKLRDSFQTRKAHVMFLIIDRDARQSFDDELHLPFHLFIR